MGHPDRLTGLDASFLHLEDATTPMHVGSLQLFEGTPPAPETLLAHVERRLDLVPRYRQKLGHVPLGSHRPIWVDDPSFDAGFHLRHAALPKPGSDAALRALAGHVFEQPLDRRRPLWELWLIEGVGDGWALLTKTHHCLIDPVAGVDLSSVLFDLDPEPFARADPAPQTILRPEPTPAAKLADALTERVREPLRFLGTIAAAATVPRQTLEASTTVARGFVSIVSAATIDRAPATPFDVRVGPHRRFAWASGRLQEFRVLRAALGGTIDDVVLTVVAGALRTFLLRRGMEVDRLEPKAMVPLPAGGDLRMSAIYVPLPIAEPEPLRRFDAVRLGRGRVRDSGQAQGSDALMRLTAFAAPSLLAQTVRLLWARRASNLVVTNLPGPQFPLYLLGSRLRAVLPQLPLAATRALSIGVTSYDGRLDFGLLADYDAVPDLDALADDIEAAIVELRRAAGIAEPVQDSR